MNTLYDCPKPGAYQVTYIDSLPFICPKCDSNCTYRQMLLNKNNCFWEQLFAYDETLSNQESFQHFLSLFADPLCDGIHVFCCTNQFDCEIGEPVRCIHCPAPNSLKCVPGRCPKNLEAVRLWNQAIHKNSVFLAELREHNIKIYPVSNEDIALSLDCTEPISQEKCRQLRSCLFSSDPNDQTFFASIKQQHLMKIYTNYSMVRPIGK